MVGTTLNEGSISSRRGSLYPRIWAPKYLMLSALARLFGRAGRHVFIDRTGRE